MKSNEKHEKFIEMNELAKIIKAKDIRTAQKWCHDVNIPIIIIGKKRVAYKFLVEAELDKRMVQLLKMRYPEQWENLYKCYQENDRFNYVLAINLKNPKTKKTINQKPKSRLAKEFLNENI